MNVVLVAPLPPPYGGISNWTQMVASFFSENNSLCVSVDVINTAPKARAVDGRSLASRFFGGAKSIFSAKKQLKVLMQDKEVDVVHITTSGSLALLRDYVLLKACKKMRVASVLHIRFGRVPEVLESGGLEKRLLLMAAKQASAVLVLDSRTNQALSLYGIKTDIIPNPVSISETLPIFDKDKNSIVFLGWVVKSKGIEELLEAWTYTQEYGVGKSATLKIAGPCKASYLKYLTENYDLNSVCFLGELEHADAWNLLNKSEILVLPSYTEGFPNVVVEAMASGCAVVATDVGAIADILQGGCGILVKREPHAIASAIIDLLSDDAKRSSMAVRGQKKAREEYKLQNVANRYINYWRRISV